MGRTLQEWERLGILKAIPAHHQFVPGGDLVVWKAVEVARQYDERSRELPPDCADVCVDVVEQAGRLVLGSRRVIEPANQRLHMNAAPRVKPYPHQLERATVVTRVIPPLSARLRRRQRSSNLFTIMQRNNRGEKVSLTAFFIQRNVKNESFSFGIKKNKKSELMLMRRATAAAV